MSFRDPINAVTDPLHRDGWPAARYDRLTDNPEKLKDVGTLGSKPVADFDAYRAIFGKDKKDGALVDLTANLPFRECANGPVLNRYATGPSA